MIYLDNNSTTQTDPAVLDAMAPCWRDQYANPSSLHLAGQSARNAIEHAREQVAALIHAKPRDIIFTSGGTEADNLAILGTLEANSSKRRIVTTGVEHVAVHALCEKLQKQDYDVVFLPTDPDGRLDLAALDAALTPDTALAAVMHANNETGVIFPIEEIAQLATARGIPLHVDAVQSAGKLPIDCSRIPCNTLALSAHKFHGPKGTGALYVAPRAKLRNQLVGGHQERDLRPGTENVPAIVGMGKAAELAANLDPDPWRTVAALRDRLEIEITARLDFSCVIGAGAPRIPNTTLIAFPGLEAEAILIGLSQRELCASSGSACSSGSLEPSHVLRAMGCDPATAKSAIRFSLSKRTTSHEIKAAIEITADVIGRLRKSSN